MPPRYLRRTAFVLLFATLPTVTLMGCELAFDFDRTPLQPVYEGGSGIGTDGGHEGGSPHDGGGAG